MENRPALRYPYVLFDLGSTLIYFDGDWPQVTADSLRACTQALRGLGYALDAQAFSQDFYARNRDYYQQRDGSLVECTAGQVLRETLIAHGVSEPDNTHMRSALKELYAVSQRHWHVEDDAHETLAGLRGAGCRLGILSNASDDDDVQTLVDAAAIRPYFDFILTSAAAGARKPHPDIFQQALANWPQVSPAQVLMVGDMRSADVAGANRLGMASAWITRRAADEGLPAGDPRYQPTYTITALTDLIELV